MDKITGLEKYKRLVLLAGLASVGTAIIFVVVKFGVWMVSGSSVIFASLTDSIFDCLASLVNLLALKFSLTPPDNEHRFGHYKTQALASLAQSAFIGGSASILISEGLYKFFSPQPLKSIDLAIYVSVFSTLFTVLLILFQGYVYRLTKSEAISADRLHYTADVMLNISVIISLYLSYMGYLWADGLFAALIGLFILKGAYDIGMNAVQILLDHSLDSKDISKIITIIVNEPGITSIHDLKTHHAGPMVFIQGHIVMDGRLDLVTCHNIINNVEHNLREVFVNAEIILHMEPDEKKTYDEVEFKDTSFPGGNA